MTPWAKSPTVFMLVNRRTLDAEPEVYLYRYEVKGIQAFILRSSKLKDIAAASAMVDSALSAPLAELATEHGGQVLMAAAGSATLRFSSFNGLKAFAEEWPMRVHELLPGPQVIAGVATAKNLAGLQPSLQVARNSPAADAYDPGPFVARAARSGLAALGSTMGVLLDRAGLALRDWDEQSPLEKRIFPSGPFTEIPFMRDNNALGEESSYLAVVHADGNGIGQHVIALLNEGDLAKFQRFSRALSEVTLEAVRAALGTIADLADKDVLQARPVVVGGDDVTMILRAKDALPFTKEYLAAFEKGCEEHKDIPSFTASAGIVYAKVRAPYHAVYAAAEELTAWVKQASDRQYSALALHRITESPMEGYYAARERDLRYDTVENGLVGGPYAISAKNTDLPTVEELERLAGLVRALPSGPLREWLRVLHGDDAKRTRASQRWIRIDEVQQKRNPEQWKDLVKLVDQGMWRDKEGYSRKTPLLDAKTLSSVMGS